MILTPADIDADWGIFDNVIKTTILPIDPNTEEYLNPSPPIEVDSLLFEISNLFEIGPNGSEIHRETRVIVLRAFQVNDGLIAAGIPGINTFKEDYKIIDDKGKSWIVESFRLLSWGTRYRCECYRIG
jgi:hypothetical protein